MNPLDDFSDWEREAAEDRADQERIEAIDRAAEAHLLEGEWIAAGKALSRLVRRGSTATSAAFSLFGWLQHNDGKRPLLRARAIQMRRYFPRERNPLSIWNDCAVFSFDWTSEVVSIDWGGGTFVFSDPAEGDQHVEYTTTITGVRFSLDDLNTLIGIDDDAVISIDTKPFDLQELKSLLNQPPRRHADTNEGLPLSTAASEGTAAEAMAGQGRQSQQRLSPMEWKRWIASYKSEHPVLPDVDRAIYPAAKEQFGNRVTQAMVRQAFTGHPPGPRKAT